MFLSSRNYTSKPAAKLGSKVGIALLLAGLLANNGQAASAYFDLDGTTAGYGTAEGGVYSWDGPNWATLTGGTNATANWIPGSFAQFLGGSNYTVVVNNPESMAGLVQAAASGTPTLTINAAGSGSLDVVPGSLTAGLPAQGFFVRGSRFMVINAPITGAGGISLGIFSGTPCTISLFGTNTYSGGTVLQSSSYLVYFNNNNSFGSGPINVNGTTFAPLLATGGAPITLANNWTNLANSGVNFASATNTPVTLMGSWAMQTFNLNLRNNGDSTAPLTVAGPITGTGGALTVSANYNGTITFSGANAYTGPTGLGGNGSSGVTLKVSSLNRVSGGSPASNLGAPTNVAGGTITIGSGAFTSTLVYTGAGETTDRILNLGGTTGGANVQNDGSGALVFTSDLTATGAGAKVLTLQGNNVANNTISGRIVNSTGGATSVIKAQAGTWVLAATNTYTGNTIVNEGVLEIAGSIQGAVYLTNTAGTLNLDSSSALPVTSTLDLSSSAAAGAVNLNFSGTQFVAALNLDGGPMASGSWGSPTSGADNTSPLFTGTGKIQLVPKPTILQQPQSVAVFPGTPNVSFSVVVAGDPSFTYVWKLNGTAISGANSSTYDIPVAGTADVGTYTCAITNNYGGIVAGPATLTLLATNPYVNSVREDSPVAYWRFNETNGTIAHDAINWLGPNSGNYVNVALNQPGYSVSDSDPAIGLPLVSTNRGYVEVTNYTPFAYNGSSTFSLEAWVNSTNFSTKQRLFSTLRLTSPNGYAFGILPGGTALEFTAGAVRDTDLTLGTALVSGLWYHLVFTCDGNNYVFYLNGQPVGTFAVSGGASLGVAVPLELGANPPGYTITGGDGGAEQVKGRMDEVAIYGSALSPDRVLAHYTNRYGTLALPIVSAPAVNPPTNYVSRSATLEAVAGGQLLSYQWYKGASTRLDNETNSTLLRSPLQLSDADYYWVRVTNPKGTVDSPSNYLAVLPIPTNSSQLNLTDGLVLHLPFDGDYSDISGRANNGTNVGATTFVGTGAVGGNALHYSTDTAISTTNYVTLGVRPDLKFGASTDFTVSYWVRQPLGSTFTNLPFFTDAIGSTGNGGFAFAPYATSATSAGGWMLSIGSMTTPSQYTTFPDSDLINDGNWHHLLHVASRVANVATYLDGAQVDSEAISFVGNIDNANAATIGQDPTGAYPVTASADLDDLGVWRRALSPLEVTGIYLAGVSNKVSFAPALVAQVPLQVRLVGGLVEISWSGSGGVLQASGTVNGGYTNVPSASSPYSVPANSAAQAFYRLKY